MFSTLIFSLPFVSVTSVLNTYFNAVVDSQDDTTWIEPMVVRNSQPWGIGHWFVFKRVCVHCIGMKATYFSDSFLITYICQLIPKLTNHINKKVNILMAPLITKIKQNLHQKNSRKACVFRRVSVSKHVCF